MTFRIDVGIIPCAYFNQFGYFPLMKFREIPENVFEVTGVCIGFIGPVLILSQIRAELISTTPSSLSPVYLAGFLMIYCFWFLYGFRFRRLAVWLGNLIGVILQICLLIIVLLK